MTELDVSRLLGILTEPEKNRLHLSEATSRNIADTVKALLSYREQKQRYGSINEDMWLEFVLWHSYN